MGVYTSKAEELPLAATFEATILFSPAQSGRGGVIFGNYKDGSRVTVNFEIYSGGAPRIYIIDDKGEKYNVIFKKANIFNGKKRILRLRLTACQKAGIVT